MGVKIQFKRQNIRKLKQKMELKAKNKSCIIVHRTLLTPNYVLDVFRNLVFNLDLKYNIELAHLISLGRLFHNFIPLLMKEFDPRFNRW